MPDKFVLMLESSTSLSDIFQHCATIIVSIYTYFWAGSSSSSFLGNVHHCSEMILPFIITRSSLGHDHRWDTTIVGTRPSVCWNRPSSASSHERSDGFQRWNGIFIYTNIHIKRFVHVRWDIHIAHCKLKLSSSSSSSSPSSFAITDSSPIQGVFQILLRPAWNFPQ